MPGLRVCIDVPDLDAALARAVAAGATLERPVSEAAWGRMANLADPFGHGLCLLQFHGRGYGELVDDYPRAGTANAVAATGGSVEA